MAEDLMGKVFSLFSSGNDPNDDISNMLKQVAKELQQNKFAKFFRMKTDEVDPSFLSFLFSVYKQVYPIKDFMRDEKKIARLRQIIIEAFMDSSTLETVKRLDSETLDARAKTTPPMDLVKEIREDFELLVSQFDQGRVNAADRCYSLVSALELLVNFDFFGLFKKIDPHFVEASFAVEAKFPPVKVTLVAKELGEFLSITQTLKPEDDWGSLFNLLKICSGQELASADNFITMIKNLREVHATKIVLLMIQFSTKNPVWHFKTKNPDEQVAETWLEARRAEVEKYIGQINNAHKNSQIRALIREIFESTNLVRLDNYTVQHGNKFVKKGADGFIYAEGFNYLAAFLEDYLDRDIKELCDILIIRGQWTNKETSKEMSEALFRIVEAPAAVAKLDKVMSEDGADGSRLKAGMMRYDHDKTQVRYINGIISKNNEDALEIINKVAQDFIVIGKHLKSLIEDVQKKHPELLVNWRELHQVSKDPILQRMVDCYKRINYFVQLMRLCTQ